MKNSLSKKRKKFQKLYIEHIVCDKNIYHLLNEYKKMINIKLSKYSDNEFIELIKDRSFKGGDYLWHVSQWANYQDFVNYVEENK